MYPLERLAAWVAGGNLGDLKDRWKAEMEKKALGLKTGSWCA